MRGDRVRHGETPRSRGTRSRMLTRLPEGIPGMCGPGPSGLPALAALLEDSSTRTRSVSRGWSPAEPGGQRSREGVLPAEVTGAAVCSRDAGSRSLVPARWEAGGRDRYDHDGRVRSPLLHHSVKLRLRSSFSSAHSTVGPISEQVIQPERSLI